MSVIPITVFFSLALAGLFVGLFAREQRRRRFASPERESLLPLADELPRVSFVAAATHGEGDHDGECRRGALLSGAGGVKSFPSATP